MEQSNSREKRQKKETPLTRGFCRLSTDIRNRRAFLAAILYASLLMTLRFLRYIHGQKVKPGEWLAVVAIGNTPCKP
jgi:hypothetical protein